MYVEILQCLVAVVGSRRYPTAIRRISKITMENAHTRCRVLNQKVLLCRRQPCSHGMSAAAGSDRGGVEVDKQWKLRREAELPS